MHMTRSVHDSHACAALTAVDFSNGMAKNLSSEELAKANKGIHFLSSGLIENFKSSSSLFTETLTSSAENSNTGSSSRSWKPPSAITNTFHIGLDRLLVQGFTTDTSTSQRLWTDTYDNHDVHSTQSSAGSSSCFGSRFDLSGYTEISSRCNKVTWNLTGLCTQSSAMVGKCHHSQVNQVFGRKNSEWKLLAGLQSLFVLHIAIKRVSLQLPTRRLSRPWRKKVVFDDRLYISNI